LIQVNNADKIQSDKILVSVAGTQYGSDIYSTINSEGPIVSIAATIEYTGETPIFKIQAMPSYTDITGISTFTFKRTYTSIVGFTD